MRPSILVLVSLLLLSLLHSKAQGIRVEKGFLTDKPHVQDMESTNLLKWSNSGSVDDEEAILCKEGQCSSTEGKEAKNRKLVSTSISSTHTISKNAKMIGVDGKEEETKVNSLPTSSKHQKVHHGHYSELVDIAEMDYSPARRKTPIHN